MNKVALLVVGIISYCGVKAQVPNFAFDSARWVVYGTLPHETRTVYITGYDTIISGKTYTTIWTDFYDGAFADTNNLELFIRPDTNNRVWFRYPSTISSDTNEYVLYDYSLMPGDTFFMNGPLFLTVDTFVVASLMSWQLYDASTVSEITFVANTQGCFFGQFVEMIGNTGHPFYPLVGLSTFPDTCLPHLECYQVNNVELYGSSGGCDVHAGSNEVNGIRCLNSIISVNLDGVNIELNCSDKIDAELRIVDLLGRELHRSKVINPSTFVPLTYSGPILISIYWEDKIETHLQTYRP